MDRSLQVSSEIKKALKQTVFLDNGKYGLVFTELESKGSAGEWRCNVCQRDIVSERAMHNHLSHPLHNSKLLMPTHPTTQFEKVVPKKNDRAEVEVVTDILPGEPVPPGMEDVVEVNCQIQKAFDAYTAGPLIGLEYIVELISTEEKLEPRYICLLCEKKGDPRSVMVHVTSHNHYLKYISCFFRTAGNALNMMSRTNETRKGIAVAVQKVAAEIENHYGRLKPTSAEMESFMSKKYEILRSIDEKQHFRETPDTTYAHLVTPTKIKEYSMIGEEPVTKKDVSSELHDYGKGQNYVKSDEKGGNKLEGSTNKLNEVKRIKSNSLNDEKTREIISKGDSIFFSDDGKKFTFKIGKPVKSMGSGDPSNMKPDSNKSGDLKDSDSDVIVLTDDKNNTPDEIEVRSLSSVSSLSRSPSPSRRRLGGRRRGEERSRSRGRGGGRSRSRERREGGSRRGYWDDDDERGRSRWWGRGRRSRSRERDRRRSPHPRSGGDDRFDRNGRRRLSPSLHSSSRHSSYYDKYGRNSPPPRLPYSRPHSRSRERYLKSQRYGRYRDERDKYDDENSHDSAHKERSRMSPRRERDHYLSRSRSPSRRGGDDYRSRRDSSPPSRSPSRRKDDVMKSPEEKEEKLRWSKYEEELKMLEEEMDAKFKYYQSKPEKHPLYPEVWKGFWNSRYKELQLSGKDPSKHDFKPEWIIFWEKKMKEIHEQEVADKKEDLRSKLNVKELSTRRDSFNNDLQDISPPTPEGARDVTVDDIKNTWKALTGSDIKGGPSRRSLSPWEESGRKSPQDVQNSNGGRGGNQSSSDKKFYEIVPPIVHCLRMLSVFEDRLGSHGSKVVDLLSKALLLEKSKPSHSMSLLQSRDIHIFFETIKEKIRGLLLAGAMPRTLVPASRAVIKSIDNMLSTNPLNREVFEPVKVPGVGMVDKVAVAQQIAAALVAQGKIDVSQEELEELINAVVGIAQATNANPIKSMSSATFFSQLDIQKSTGSSHINQILNNMIVSAQKSLALNKEISQVGQVVHSQPTGFVPNKELSINIGITPKIEEVSKQNYLQSPLQSVSTTSSVSSGINMLQYSVAKNIPMDIGNKDSVSDVELKERLMNFKDLPREEQQSLIALLKELETTQPERVEKLREFVAVSLGQQIGSVKQSVVKPQPQSHNTGRLSPFSSRAGNANPPPENSMTSSPNVSKAFPSYGNSKTLTLNDSEDDDDDYSFEDVYKAASEKLKIKQQEEEEKRRKAEEEKKKIKEAEIKREEELRLKREEELRLKEEEMRLKKEEEARRMEEIRMREHEEMLRRQAEESEMMRRKIIEEEEIVKRRHQEEEEMKVRLRMEEEAELRRRYEEERMMGGGLYENNRQPFTEAGVRYSQFQTGRDGGPISYPTDDPYQNQPYASYGNQSYTGASSRYEDGGGEFTGGTRSDYMLDPYNAQYQGYSLDTPEANYSYNNQDPYRSQRIPPGFGAGYQNYPRN